MKVIRTGVTRTVVLVGRWAVKVPSLAEYIHRHWLDWSFWTLIGVYASAVVVAFWHPFWVVTISLAYITIVLFAGGSWADSITYRRMKREQER